ncbi:DUF1571 domain-containing protein [Schlesneria paludicola]|uniref:DUF1571 domain-containing protein n=1 Tax=Schlesneria paludicola TaxID=360056 RepID=UPI00029AC780|nr:DUF1571 domain-containing protein [Schlesneria paludicola]
MHSISIRTKLLMFVAVAFNATALPIWAADEEVLPTAATKSDETEKPPIDETHPLYKLLEVAYKSRNALDDVKDYKCVFSKREVVRGKMIKTSMNLKFREDPFSVYLKFIDLNAGREVIYVKGQNENNMLVHEAGVKSFLGTFKIVPTGPDAMAENKYPVTQIGLKNMLATVIKQWEAEGKFSGIKTQLRPTSKLPSGEVCTVYEAIHTQQFKEFKFHTTRLFVSDETGIAIGVQQLGFPGKNDKEPPVVEEYFYSQLQANLKLTDADFNPKNPGYAFP